MNRKGGTVLPSSVLIFIEKKNHMSKKRVSRPLTHPGPTFSFSNNRVEFFRFDQNRNGGLTLTFVASIHNLCFPAVFFAL
jgi:hypothetical protein